MPIKNVIKSYKPETYYHLYNLGIENRIIFEDDIDYQVFLDFLEQSLTPPKTKEALPELVTIKGQSFHGSPRQPINLHGLVELHSFVLMPTHWHLLVKQKQLNGIETFMRSLGTRYVMHFNKRHSRRGPLFQGTYKAIDVTNEAMILHLTRFMHLKAKTLPGGFSSLHSSYPAYTHQAFMPFVTTHEIEAMLDRDGLLRSLNPTYQHFIENFQEDSTQVLGSLTLA